MHVLLFLNCLIYLPWLCNCIYCIAELMVLGFISLLLTFGQSYIADICIPMKYANTMLPCRLMSEEGHGGEGGEGGKGGEGGQHRRLLSFEQRRFLSAETKPECKEVLYCSATLLFSFMDLIGQAWTLFPDSSFPFILHSTRATCLLYLSTAYTSYTFSFSSWLSSMCSIVQ